MYNSVAALAGARRALIEAYQFLSYRQTFGKIALSHALVRAKLWELGSLYRATHALVWRAVAAMDRAETGDKREAELLRLLTPMVKRDSAELAVYSCRESMELMGGMGYIEDTVLPKTMRDMMVLPIWEGAGNIMVLDMLRACVKSEGLHTLLAEIQGICAGGGVEAASILGNATTLVEQLAQLSHLPQDAMEYQAKGLFLKLTRSYQAALLLQAADIGVGGKLACDWLLQTAGLMQPRDTPPTEHEIQALVSWEF
jgi:acyl-CoA dehydrogenase